MMTPTTAAPIHGMSLAVTLIMPCSATTRQLASLRQQNQVLTAGDLRVLLADDAAGMVAYGRKTGSQAAVIIINRYQPGKHGRDPCRRLHP